jgi:hypothetical protein
MDLVQLVVLGLKPRRAEQGRQPANGQPEPEEPPVPGRVSTVLLDGKHRHAEDNGMKPILARLAHGWCHAAVIALLSLDRRFSQPESRVSHFALWDTINPERTSFFAPEVLDSMAQLSSFIAEPE